MRGPHSDSERLFSAPGGEAPSPQPSPRKRGEGASNSSTTFAGIEFFLMTALTAQESRGDVSPAMQKPQKDQYLVGGRVVVDQKIGRHECDACIGA